MANLIPLTGFTNASGFSDVVSYGGTVTDGLLTGGLLIVIYLIILIALVKRNYDMVDVIVADSLVCFVLSLFTRYMGWTSLYMSLAFLLLLAIGGVFAYLGNKN